MDPAVAGSPGSAPPPTFEDGLGERRYTIGPGNNALESLSLRKVLCAVPSFEFGLRERAGRLADFRNPWYGRVHAIEVDKLTSELVVVSDYVPGVRLATLLADAEKRSIPVAIDAARCLIRQLLSAVQAWQEVLPGVSHGAIGPERIVLTPQGQLVVVEYVLGSALEQLRCTRAEYWKQLRVVLPEPIGRRLFDARVDITQVGAVAVAVLLGRRLADDEYPEKIGELVSGAAIPSGVRDWLLRALQLDPDGSFVSANDARRELDDALGSENPVAELRALRTLLTRWRLRDVSHDSSSAADESSSAPDEPPDVDLSPRIEALKAFLARYPLREGFEEPAPALPTANPADPEHAGSPGPDSPSDDRHTSPQFLPGSWPQEWTRSRPIRFLTSRRSLIAGAVALAIVLAGFAFSALRGGLPSVTAARTGALLIVTDPAGIKVSIDGNSRGVTPLSVDLPPGNHVVDLVTGSDRRRIPVTIAAGGQVSHFLELPRAAQAVGELLVRTNVPGVTVSVDGRVAGRSPVTVPGLSPGAHTVVLQHQSASVTERVSIESGRTTSLVVSMPSAPVSTAAGWVTVSAPAEVQVFENKRLLGNSSIERIMLPVGRHQLQLVNEALNYRTSHSVEIAAGDVERIALKWPNGSLAINAIPWAEVWVDGQPVGETPIRSISLPVGVHEVVFRHPQLGERRASVTVPAGKPTTFGVDMGAK